MRRLRITLVLLALAWPAVLPAATPGLQTPGYRAAWGAWTREGYRVGRAACPAERRIYERAAACRANSRGSAGYGGWYTSASVNPAGFENRVFRGQTIGGAGRGPVAVAYGYGGRYGSDVCIMSPGQYRATRGVTIGKR